MPQSNSKKWRACVFTPGIIAAFSVPVLPVLRVVFYGCQEFWYSPLCFTTGVTAIGMTIGIVSPEYPPKTHWGGVATYHALLAASLEKLGHDVHVFTLDPDRVRPHDVRHGGITVHYVGRTFGSAVADFLYFIFPGKIIRSVLNRYLPDLLFTVDWNIFALRAFDRIHGTLSIDMLHTPTYSVPALLIARFHPDIPVAVHVHGLERQFAPYRRHTADAYLRTAFERYYLRTVARFVIACSRNVLRAVRHDFPEISSRTFHIPNAVSVPHRKAANRYDGGRIIYFGALERRKGVDLLVAAFRRIAATRRGVTLELYGPERLPMEFRNSRLRFREYLARQRMADTVRSRILLRSDGMEHTALMEELGRAGGVAVFPARYEPFGLSTAEAMALGYVVIASNRGGGTEIIEDGVTGYLVQPTIVGLTSALRKALKLNASQRRRITERAVRHVREHFGPERFVRNLGAWYDRYGMMHQITKE